MSQTPETEQPKKPLRLPVAPDARKSLAKLKEEWRTCQACPLGVRRVAVDGQFVFGEGRRGGIMFIGEGPGKDEEAEGGPFVGKSGKLLRGVLEKLEIKDYYISNTVACRSCVPITDADGNPIMTKGYRGRPPEPRYKDQPPTKAEVEACRPRLMEEIYIVDPTVIVALGGQAAEFLRGKSTTITRDRGQAMEISVPGATQIPSLTSKGMWHRKTKGVVHAPIEQNEVQYLMIPTLHPAYVLRQANDESKDNPFQQFYRDIRYAAEIYNRYQLEVYGVVAAGLSEDIPYELVVDEQYNAQNQESGS